MSSQNVRNFGIYGFDGYHLDAAKYLLFDSQGRPVPIKSKAFETLLFLVRNPGRLIERDELMEAIWPGMAVEENNLTQHISALRRALGETKDDHRFIVTVPGHGYKFLGEVTLLSEASSIPSAARSEKIASGFRWLTLFSSAIVVALLLLGLLFRPAIMSGDDDRIRSIAVLPFKPVSQEDRNPSFENALTSDLITRLEQAEGITVRPFHVVKRFSSVERDPAEAGRELAVDAVLVPTVQFSGDRVRIFVKLIKVEGARPIWSQPFDEDRSDLFELQDEMTERVANALKVKLSENAGHHRPTTSDEAYELYLQGRSHQLNLEPTETKLGIEKFEQAIAIDPNFALAYAGIAKGNMSLVLSTELAPGVMAEKAFAAAERSVELDPQLAEGFATLGAINFWFRHDWAASERALKRALDLQPNSAFAHLYYAVLLGNTGRIEEALDESKRARELDEFSAYSTSMQGTTLVHAGRPGEALERFSEAKRMNPRLWTPHCKAALAFIDLRQYDEAVAAARTARELNQAQTNSIAYESYALAKLGRRDEATRLLDGMLARSREQHVPPYHIAVAYAGLGDRRNALTWLEKAFFDSDPKIVFIRSERFWTEYRGEPRYVELLKRMNLDNAP